jgi:superfamily II DNA or RNA helicase
VLDPVAHAIDEIESFALVRDVSGDVGEDVLASVRALDEREQLEPFIRRILFDAGETPHGPAEIADILTHKVRIAGRSRYAAFVLKGRAYSTVRPSHIAHQIYRLEKVGGLEFAVLAASGVILDAVREQFVSTAVRLGVAYSVLDAGDLGRLFIAYGFLCPRDGRDISAGRCACGYSPKRRIPNPLQVDAKRALAEAHEAGQRRGLIVLPPGSGKTRIAADDAAAVGARSILYVAHTHEILDVAQAELEAVFGTSEVARIASGRDLAENRRARIATVQLLSHRRDQHLGAIDYLVVDEFHHAAATTYRWLLESVGAAFVLGLTATPFRGDRQDIAALCDHNVLVEFELRAGIETGVLTPYHYFGCFDDIDYSNIRHNGQRYDIKDLEKALVVPERDEAIIRQWRLRADGKPTLAFCATKLHARRFAEALRRSGVAAQPYLDDTPRPERVETLRKLQTGEVKVLTVVDVLNEGADIPFVECLLFLRPTESKRVFHQQLGRGLRQAPGKAYCTVVDFVGNFRNAFRIVEYHDLVPEETGPPAASVDRIFSRKDLLNLPLGCEVTFDERVIDLFAQQATDLRYATRHNIARILLHRYTRLHVRLGREPSRSDVDRSSLLSSDFYVQVFGSWGKFMRVYRNT